MIRSSLPIKSQYSYLLAFFLLLILVSIVGALTLGNADGVWSGGTSYGGGTPTCLRYGAEDNPSTTQGANSEDENQVRYGRPWPEDDCSPFTAQSGFGFDGSSGDLIFNPGDVFLLGQFTHYNRPISIEDDDMNNRLRTVDLAITLNFTDPVLNTVLNYQMELDETLNSADPCPYGDSTADGEYNCDDKVTFPASLADQTFDIGGVTYTLQIVGFVPGNTETCSADSGTVDNFVTGEDQQNDACLFGRILEVTYDFGDAPDINGQTMLGSGARHTIDPEGPFLGLVRPDSEADGQPNAAASGDDIGGTPDDEDGFTGIFPDDDPTDGEFSIEVIAAGIAPLSSACVSGWIDWGADGFGNDTPAIFTATTNGALALPFSTPDQIPEEAVNLRLRIVPGSCSGQSISATGLQQGGEIEDFAPVVPRTTAVNLLSMRAAAAGVSWWTPLLLLALLLPTTTLLVLRARRRSP